MSIVLKPVLASSLQALPIQKLREKSADSVLYTLRHHNIEMPQTLTVTSSLPSPRKGNPGTVKTVMNLRLTDKLDRGLPTERNVPIIIKLETSFPVGSDSTKRMSALLAMATVLTQAPNAADSLFYSGLLPEFTSEASGGGDQPGDDGDGPK